MISRQQYPSQGKRHFNCHVTIDGNIIEMVYFFILNTEYSASLPGVQEKLGVMNKGLVYTLWDYTAQQADELSFSEGDALTVLRRRDDTETEWWWARLNDREGYIPRNLLGVRELRHNNRHLFINVCTHRALSTLMAATKIGHRQEFWRNPKLDRPVVFSYGC